MTSDNQETSTTSNRVALVTGGTRGIGQEISKKLKKDGFFVIANYASNEQKALDFSNETGIETVKWDVSNYEECSGQIQKIYDMEKKAAPKTVQLAKKIKREMDEKKTGVIKPNTDIII